MRRQRLVMVLATAVMLAAAAAEAAGPMSARDRSEFNRLVLQRNELYTQLARLNDGGRADEVLEESAVLQNQLDIIEQRLSELADRHGLEVPRPSRYGNEPVRQPDGRAAPAPGVGQPTAKQRAEFNKLVLERNRLHARLAELDDRATGLLKEGRNPMVIHAEQVSIEDRLDLIELRLAILATRYGLAVPPVPGAAPAAGSRGLHDDDPSQRHIELAFARGRDRAAKLLRTDGERFMASLDFRKFLEN